MRKEIFFCDICGREINEKHLLKPVLYFYLYPKTRIPGQEIPQVVEIQIKRNHGEIPIDICLGCAKKLFSEISKKLEMIQNTSQGYMHLDTICNE